MSLHPGTACLTKSLRFCSVDSARRVKIILSDRVGPHARNFKVDASVFELGNIDAADDVRRLIQDRTSDLCVEARIPYRSQLEVQDTLVSLSEGVFLHASLAWANFYGGVTYWSSEVVRQRLQRVKAIPNDAVSYYCALLDRIPLIPQRGHGEHSLGFSVAGVR